MLSVMAVAVDMINGNNGNVIVVIASIIILYNIYNIAYVTFKIPNIIGTLICSNCDIDKLYEVSDFYNVPREEVDYWINEAKTEPYYSMG